MFTESHDYSGGYGWWKGAGHRMARGDMSPIVLDVLQEKPMHGYEIIRKLEERSHGFWRPSAGSIYPTLQLLEEQELVTSHEEDGKKVYALTEQGRKAATEGKHESAHWKHKFRHGKRFVVLKETMRGFIIHMRHIGIDGSDEDISKAKAILDHAVEELAEIAKNIPHNSKD